MRTLVGAKVLGTMTPLDHALTLAQKVIGDCPLIVLGSGASAPYGLPSMWRLGEHLKSTIDPDLDDEEECADWKQFVANLARGRDLEAAITDVKSAKLTARVVDSTWALVAEADLKVLDRVLADRQCLPLTRLFKYLLNSARSELHVVTPNYDRLAEYAAEAAGIHHYTGLTFGHMRRRSDAAPQLRHGTSKIDTINIWKVHGSLDWFSDQHGSFVALPLRNQKYANTTPMIVTPGITKYQKTHEEPFRSILTAADLALARAKSYLCIGYGFNDTHLQEKLVEHCAAQKATLAVITKELTPPTRKFLSSNRCGPYIALEESVEGTMMFSREYPSGVVIPVPDLWTVSGFLREATEGL